MLPYKSQKCRLTSRFGYRIHPITGWGHFHGGVDLVGVGSDEIVAVADGTVVRSRIVTNKSDATWEWGEYIAITGTDGMTIYYCHLAKRLVKVGAKVKAGDVIGVQGMTGQATGPHLHFEVRKGSKQVNAAEYVGIENLLGTYNGVTIAIDKLAALGVIDTPAFWYEHYREPEYLGEFLVKSADKITVAGEAYSDISIALERLESVDIVNTPAYWIANAPKYEHVTELICKIGGCV